MDKNTFDQEYIRLLANAATGGPASNELVLETAVGAERLPFNNGGASSG